MNDFFRQCPKCGERIESEFDVCWNCGADRVGIASEDSGQANEHVVELCSAANSVEAGAICAVLEDEGIPAQIVGDVLGNATGMLPFGEATAPRVWVRQSDAARAREVLARRLEETESEPAEWDDNLVEKVDNLSYAEPKEEVLPSDVRFRFLSQGFYIIGAVCIMGGVYWAWQNRLLLAEYSATAEGRWVGDKVVGMKSILTPGGGRRTSLSWDYVSVIRPWYVYVVGDENYYALGDERYCAPREETEIATDDVLVHYIPHRPEKHVVGPIAPPEIILVLAVGVGAFSMFVGFKFR